MKYLCVFLILCGVMHAAEIDVLAAPGRVLSQSGKSQLVATSVAGRVLVQFSYQGKNSQKATIESEYQEKGEKWIAWMEDDFTVWFYSGKKEILRCKVTEKSGDLSYSYAKTILAIDGDKALIPKALLDYISIAYKM